ncbi:MAG TPA: hypothetical protein VF507_06825 [Pyrinomonadaceae bacterium]
MKYFRLLALSCALTLAFTLTALADCGQMGAPCDPPPPNCQTSPCTVAPGGSDTATVSGTFSEATQSADDAVNTLEQTLLLGILSVI